MLFIVEPIDEYAVQQLKEFEGKKLLCSTKEGLTMNESDGEFEAPTLLPLLLLPWDAAASAATAPAAGGCCRCR